MSATYESVVHERVTAEQYTGPNFGDIARFIGPGRTNMTYPLPQVLTFDRAWVTLQPGWWVILVDEADVVVLSERLFSCLFRKRVDTSSQGV